MNTAIKGKRLFRPSSPATDERVRAGSTEFMFLDSNLVTVDGSECNKVGTSYKAFATQVNACKLSIGTCLDGQLNDYRSMDLAMMAGGTTGSFMGPNYGNFTFQPSADSTPYLAYDAGVMPVPAVLNVIFDPAQATPSASYAPVTVSRVYLAQPIDSSNSAHPNGVVNAYDLRTGVVSGGFAVEVVSAAPLLTFVGFKFSKCSPAIQLDSVSAGAASGDAPLLWVKVHPSATTTFKLLLQTGERPPLNTYVTCTLDAFDFNGGLIDSRELRWAITNQGFLSQLPKASTTTTTTTATTTTAKPGGDSSGNGGHTSSTSTTHTPAVTTTTSARANSGPDRRKSKDACHGCTFGTVARSFSQGCGKYMAGNIIVLVVIVLVVIVAVVVLAIVVGLVPFRHSIFCCCYGDGKRGDHTTTDSSSDTGGSSGNVVVPRQARGPTLAPAATSATGSSGSLYYEVGRPQTSGKQQHMLATSSSGTPTSLPPPPPPPRNGQLYNPDTPATVALGRSPLPLSPAPPPLCPATLLRAAAASVHSQQQQRREEKRYIRQQQQLAQEAQIQQLQQQQMMAEQLMQQQRQQQQAAYGYQQQQQAQAQQQRQRQLSEMAAAFAAQQQQQQPRRRHGVRNPNSGVSGGGTVVDEVIDGVPSPINTNPNSNGNAAVEEVIEEVIPISSAGNDKSPTPPSAHEPFS